MHLTSTAVLVGGLAILPGTLACDKHLRSRAAQQLPPLPLTKLAARQDTSGVKRPELGSVPYGINVDRCTVPGKAVITFDDGPDVYTKELLDILAKNNVKATFFLTGDNGRFGRPTIDNPSGPYPDLVRRMHKEGHQIGSHSWSHENFTTISASERAQELLKLESAFVDILGFFPTYFRPPFTSFEGTEDELARFGYHNINFDLDTQDFVEDYAVSRQKVSAGLAAKGPTKASFITLLHEIHELSVTEFLPWIISEARKYNYDFVTVGECLDDHPNNWYRDPKTGGPWGGPPPVKEKPAASSSSSNNEVKSTTSASKPMFSESTPKAAITNSAPGNTTVTTSTTSVAKTAENKVASTAAPAVTTTPAAIPNAGVKVEGLGWVGGILLGAMGVFLWL